MIYYWYYYLLGIILLPGIIFSIYAQFKVNSNFNTYNQEQARCNIPANELARHLLSRNGLHDTRIEKCRGELTDHYNPKTNVVSLSESVYDSNSVASIAVMAHELGHVLQHKERYGLMRLRSILIPFINISSILMWPLVILGLILESSINTNWGFILICIGVGIFALSTILSLITLPIEKDASRRAEKMLLDMNVLNTEECQHAKKVLSSACLTYVASLITSILSMIRFAFFVLSFTRRER